MTCECGCGQTTPICQYTLRTKGYFKGQHLRFVPGHQGNLTKWSDERREKMRATMTGRKHTAATCRKMSEYNRSRGIKPSADAVAKSHANRQKGAANPSWKGGVTTYANGYRLLYMREHPRAHPNGYVYEHIVVAERKLGRSLDRDEVVHHIDGDKSNNSPDNLHVFTTQADHVRHHQKTRAPRSS